MQTIAELLLTRRERTALKKFLLKRKLKKIEKRFNRDRKGINPFTINKIKNG